MATKAAVFEIREFGGVSRLLCVGLESLQEAVKLEAELNRRSRSASVRFVGRFDGVAIGSDLKDLVKAVTLDECFSATRSKVSCGLQSLRSHDVRKPPSGDRFLPLSGVRFLMPLAGR